MGRGYSNRENGRVRMTFSKWLNTFVDEKGLDRDHVFEVNGSEEWGTNYIPLECVLEACMIVHKDDQSKIKDQLIHIDFRNGNVMDFFEYLAKGLAQ